MRLALLQYLLVFLGAELMSVLAAEYAIFEIVHSFLLSRFGLMVTLGSRWMLKKRCGKNTFLTRACRSGTASLRT